MTIYARAMIWHNGRINPSHEATVHVERPRAALRLLGVRGRARLRHTARAALFPSRPITRADCSSRRASTTSTSATAKTRSTQAVPSVILANDLTRAYVRPIVFRGAGSASACCRMRHRRSMWRSWRWLGRVSRRRGVTNGCGRLRVVVASAAPNTLPELGQGRRQLSLQPADRLRSAARRLRRRHRARPQRPAQRRRRRESVPGQARQAAHAADERRHSRRHHPRQRDHAGRRSRHHAVEERDLPREALYTADEVFMTGTAAEITPIRSVDRKPSAKASRARSRARCRMRSSACSTAARRSPWLADPAACGHRDGPSARNRGTALCRSLARWPHVRAHAARQDLGRARRSPRRRPRRRRSCTSTCTSCTR